MLLCFPGRLCALALRVDCDIERRIIGPVDSDGERAIYRCSANLLIRAGVEDLPIIRRAKCCRFLGAIPSECMCRRPLA